MGCSSCSTGANGSPKGCQNNGHCSTGGCNRLNSFDWLTMLDIHDPDEFDVVELSFKNGARKGFFRKQPHTRASTGDMVVVDVGNGYDIGRIALSGELTRLQMKRKRVSEDRVINTIIRKANERDLERLQEARDLEQPAMVRARTIARMLDLEMKIGDVEYRGDKRKATFYYTAEGRVDFRELVRNYAKEFRVKIEMRQIGARQESARIGGIGACGRELCCSTWLTDFKTVTTSAARYQNLSINQTKLSGQCGRLKCCLNYELDTYMDALRDFPKNVDELYTENGKAVLIKTDIFKKLMYFAYLTERGRSNITPVHVDRVKEIKAANDAGERPEQLIPKDQLENGGLGSDEVDFEDVTGVIELPIEKRRKKRRSGRRRGQGRSKGNTGSQKGEKKEQPQAKGKNQSPKNKKGKSRNRRRNRPRPNQPSGNTSDKE